VVEKWINKTQSSKVSSREIRPIRKKRGFGVRPTRARLLLRSFSSFSTLCCVTSIDPVEWGINIGDAPASLASLRASR
jgi:hypothetical protein